MNDLPITKVKDRIVQDFILTFENGEVQVEMFINPHTFDCYIYNIKCSEEKIGLGEKAVRLLNAYGYTPLYAEEAIVPALPFWNKMLERGLIDGYNECECDICEKLRAERRQKYANESLQQLIKQARHRSISLTCATNYISNQAYVNTNGDI